MSSQQQSGGRDERFGRVRQDPRFWEMPDSERRVKIDRRFQAMFTEPRFQAKQTVDKRGRPVQHTAREDLRRFYNLPEEQEEQEEQEGGKRKTEGKPKGKTGAPRGEKHGDEEEEEEVSEPEGGSDEEESSGLDSGSEDSGPDLARGVGNVETSSDEDEEEEEDEVEAFLRREEEEIEHDWGDLCKDAPRRDEVSSRLAVCNLDWDRLKAPDLLALFNSFKPPGGVVLSVKIYPSEFGRQRLQQEETQGPLELPVQLPEDPEKDSEEDRVHREKLRDYQFKRLRYFFAVVECDSVDTATKLYEECDGFEYESSCSVLDLRFIPDDMVFDEEPRGVATEVELSSYTPKLFTSAAASTSKVEVTWDETDHERVTALSRTFNKSDLLEMDFNAYLASSSEEEQEEQGGTGDKLAGEQSEQPPAEEEEVEEEDEEDTRRRRRKNKKKKGEEQISRYRELLKGLQQKESQQRADKEMEMEVSWVPGLRETTERLVKRKMEEKQEQRTPWEEFLQKKRERRKKQRRSQEEPGGGGDDDDGDDVPSDVDLNDPYFAEELGAAAVAAGGRKRPTKEEEEEEEEVDEVEVEKRKAEMSLLMEDGEDEKHQHFNFEKIVEQQNLSKKKRKRLQKKNHEDIREDTFQVDVADPRFQALFSSHLFNLDPSHPSYQPTRGTQSILAEKWRQRAQQETHHHREQEVQTTEQQEVEVVGSAKKKKKEGLDPGLSLLVKSIKSKTQQFQARKKQRLV